MTSSLQESSFDAIAAARAVSDGVLAGAAERVDAEASFPAAGVAALRDAGLLAAAVPTSHGGMGLDVVELVDVARELGQGCGATAMVWAMHQIQVACIVRHGRTTFLDGYLREIARSQPLLASATSEVGTGGQLLRSIAALETGDDGQIIVSKKATTVSYGEFADGILTSVRRDPEAEGHDQLLVLLLADDGLDRVRTGEWNVMGMRGTVSPPFELSCATEPDRVLADPFARIAAESMIPLSHLLWSACWVGIAADATRRAVAATRASGRKDVRVAEAQGLLRVTMATLTDTARMYSDCLPSGRFEVDGPAIADRLGPDFTVALNVLKVSASRTLVRVAELALEVCGIGGYREDGPQSVARHLRDLYSARLMISNRRLLETNAQLALVAMR